MNNQRLKESVLLEHFLSQADETLFLKAASDAVSRKKSGQKKYFSISFSIPDTDPLAVLHAFGRTDGFEYFWEKPSAGFAMAAAGELARTQATGPARFKDASTGGKKIFSEAFHYSATPHPQSKLHLLGGFSFFDHNVSKAWKDFGAASFTLPEWIIIRTAGTAIMTASISLRDIDTPEALTNRLYTKLNQLSACVSASTPAAPEIPLHEFAPLTPPSKTSEHEKWIQMIVKAKEQIRSKAYSKIVLAREITMPLKNKISGTRILSYLRRQYPDCYTFMIRKNEDSCFVGSTPERLAYFNGDELHTEGLAGSSPRGKTAEEDARLEYELLHSQKNLNEHNFVLEAISEDLIPYSDDVEIKDRPAIKKLNNVLHLHTPIKAKISPVVSKTDVLKTLHPTPAVGGFPRRESKPYISRLEGFERGWYAAPFGWITEGAEAEFIVAIRSALIKKDEVRFYAGCGIVEGSDPEKEWEETNIKLIPMLSALGYADR